MKDWSEEILGPNVNHKKGFAFKSNWFQEEGTPVVKVTNFTENSIELDGLVYVSHKIAKEKHGYRLNKNDVIIQTVGSWPNNPASVVGKVIKVPSILNNSLLNQNAVVIYPSSKINNIFLFYLLKSNNFKGYIINTAQGAANQASITLDSIFRFPFYLPPLPLQKKIASVLSAYDELIENNSRRIAILEKMAEEIYREWFVRMRFPGHKKVKIVKGIPEGWDFHRLSDIFRFEKGKNPKHLYIDFNIDFYPYINIEFIEGNSVKYVNESNMIYCSKTETLMLMDGARSGLVFNGISGAVGSTLSVIRTDERHKFVLHGYLKANHETIIFNNTGSAIPHANKDFILRMLICLPKSKQIIEEFNKLYLPIFDEVLNLKSANENLMQSRDLNLPRLISGKLDIEKLDIVSPPGLNNTDPTEGKEAEAA